ncbi:LLM class flavin-dependent oxidoreductase [Mycobacterium kansasii]|uniref:LLM class flavin-dependent oxidoreductase n=1 Tax=Mycobacterium kansasii TaxID=1768 RepID=UPI0034A0B555
MTFTGDHIRVEGAALNNRPDPVPPRCSSADRPASAGPVAAKYSDVYLTWGEPLGAVGDKLDWIGGLAAEHAELCSTLTDSRDQPGHLRAGLAEADRLLDGIDPADVARMQANLARSESEDSAAWSSCARQQRPTVIAPNLWAGVGLVRGGAGTALVGSHDEVADRLAEYAAVGHHPLHPVGISAPGRGLLVW